MEVVRPKMKNFIKIISKWDVDSNKGKILKIDIEKLNEQILSPLTSLLSGKNPIQNLSSLAYYLGIQKIPFVNFLSLFYLFIKGIISHDILVEGAITFYKSLANITYNGEITTLLSHDVWEKQIKLSLKVERNWDTLKWKEMDRTIFQIPDHLNVPRSVSTLIDKKSDNEYEKVVIAFDNDQLNQDECDLPDRHQMNVLNPDIGMVIDSSQEGHKAIFSNITITNSVPYYEKNENLKVNTVEDNNESTTPKKGISVDVLFLTKLKISRQSSGKWIKGSAVLNQFTKELTLYFTNNQKIVLNADSGYYTWKHNWVQFRFINGLKLVIRTKGLSEINDRLKIVQFAMDCKLHYFEDINT